MSDRKEQIRTIIREEYQQWFRNRFVKLDQPDEPMWQEPSVGFAAGDDPYFSFYKKDIGEFVWLPQEAFSLKYKDSNVQDQGITVISMAFPQSQQTKEDQSGQTLIPCKRWYTTRGEWENTMAYLLKSIEKRFEQQGSRAVSIDLLPELCWMESQKYGASSRWSHRHAAHISGLGTFGLSEGLITRSGKAVRLTTILLNESIQVDPRPYLDYHGWCKFFQDGSCGTCIKRCPADAISVNGHDKAKCSAYEDKIKQEWISSGGDPNYISSCGLCQCGVPCQSQSFETK